MLEHLSEYSGLPKSADDIPLREGVRSLPYIRFVADAICDDPTDRHKLQVTLWRLDSMSDAEVKDIFDKTQAQLADQVTEQN